MWHHELGCTRPPLVLMPPPGAPCRQAGPVGGRAVTAPAQRATAAAASEATATAAARGGGGGERGGGGGNRGGGRGGGRAALAALTATPEQAQDAAQALPGQAAQPPGFHAAPAAAEHGGEGQCAPGRGDQGKHPRACTGQRPPCAQARTYSAHTRCSCCCCCTPKTPPARCCCWLPHSSPTPPPPPSPPASPGPSAPLCTGPAAHHPQPHRAAVRAVGGVRAGWRCWCWPEPRTGRGLHRVAGASVSDPAVELERTMLTLLLSEGQLANAAEVLRRACSSAP